MRDHDSISDLNAKNPSPKARSARSLGRRMVISTLRARYFRGLSNMRSGSLVYSNGCVYLIEYRTKEAPNIENEKVVRRHMRLREKAGRCARLFVKILIIIHSSIIIHKNFIYKYHKLDSDHFRKSI